MSLNEWLRAGELENMVSDDDYYALIMAAMKMADDENLAKLQEAFPELWQEVQKRYHAPGGMLPGEVDRVRGYRCDASGQVHRIRL